MVYIGADGSVSNTKPKFSFIYELFSSIYGFLALLIGSITGNPNTIRANPNVNTRRNRVRGSNIRQMRNLGTADAKCGAGG